MAKISPSQPTPDPEIAAPIVRPPSGPKPAANTPISVATATNEGPPSSPTQDVSDPAEQLAAIQAEIRPGPDDSGDVDVEAATPTRKQLERLTTELLEQTEEPEDRIKLQVQLAALEGIGNAEGWERIVSGSQQQAWRHYLGILQAQTENNAGHTPSELEPEPLEPSHADTKATPTAAGAGAGGGQRPPLAPGPAPEPDEPDRQPALTMHDPLPVLAVTHDPESGPTVRVDHVTAAQLQSEPGDTGTPALDTIIENVSQWRQMEQRLLGERPLSCLNPVEARNRIAAAQTPEQVRDVLDQINAASVRLAGFEPDRHRADRLANEIQAAVDSSEETPWEQVAPGLAAATRQPRGDVTAAMLNWDYHTRQFGELPEELRTVHTLPDSPERDRLMAKRNVWLQEFGAEMVQTWDTHNVVDDRQRAVLKSIETVPARSFFDDDTGPTLAEPDEIPVVPAASDIPPRVAELMALPGARVQCAIGALTETQRTQAEADVSTREGDDPAPGGRRYAAAISELSETRYAGLSDEAGIAAVLDVVDRHLGIVAPTNQELTEPRLVNFSYHPVQAARYFAFLEPLPNRIRELAGHSESFRREHPDGSAIDARVLRNARKWAARVIPGADDDPTVAGARTRWIAQVYEAAPTDPNIRALNPDLTWAPLTPWLDDVPRSEEASAQIGAQVAVAAQRRIDSFREAQEIRDDHTLHDANTFYCPIGTYFGHDTLAIVLTINDPVTGTPVANLDPRATMRGSLESALRELENRRSELTANIKLAEVLSLTDRDHPYRTALDITRQQFDQTGTALQRAVTALSPSAEPNDGTPVPSAAEVGTHLIADLLETFEATATSPLPDTGKANALTVQFARQQAYSPTAWRRTFPQTLELAKTLCDQLEEHPSVDSLDALHQLARVFTHVDVSDLDPVSQRILDDLRHRAECADLSARGEPNDRYNSAAWGTRFSEPADVGAEFFASAARAWNIEPEAMNDNDRKVASLTNDGVVQTSLLASIGDEHRLGVFITPTELTAEAEQEPRLVRYVATGILEAEQQRLAEVQVGVTDPAIHDVYVRARARIQLCLDELDALPLGDSASQARQHITELIQQQLGDGVEPGAHADLGLTASTHIVTGTISSAELRERWEAAQAAERDRFPDTLGIRRYLDFHQDIVSRTDRGILDALDNKHLYDSLDAEDVDRLTARGYLTDDGLPFWQRHQGWLARFTAVWAPDEIHMPNMQLASREYVEVISRIFAGSNLVAQETSLEEFAGVTILADPRMAGPDDEPPIAINVSFWNNEPQQLSDYNDLLTSQTNDPSARHIAYLPMTPPVSEAIADLMSQDLAKFLYGVDLDQGVLPIVIRSETRLDWVNNAIQLANEKREPSQPLITYEVGGEPPPQLASQAPDTGPSYDPSGAGVRPEPANAEPPGPDADDLPNLDQFPDSDPPLPGSLAKAWQDYNGHESRALETNDPAVSRILGIAHDMVRDREPIRPHDEFREALLEAFRAASEGREFVWRLTDNAAELSGIRADDTARKKDVNERVSTIRWIAEQRNQLGQLQETGFVDAVSVHENGKAFTVAHQIQGNEDAKVCVVLFSGNESPALQTGPQDQIESALVRFRSAPAVPDDVAVIAVASSYSEDPGAVVGESMRLAKHLAPDAKIVAEFPQDPWEVNSATGGISGGVTHRLSEAFNAAETHLLPDIAIARKIEPEPEIENPMQRAMRAVAEGFYSIQERVEPARGNRTGPQVVAGEQLSGKPRADWLNNPASWQRLSRALADPAPAAEPPAAPSTPTTASPSPATSQTSPRGIDRLGKWLRQRPWRRGRQ